MNKFQICHLDITQIKANQTTLTLSSSKPNLKFFIFETKSDQNSLSVKPRKSQEHVELLHYKNHKNTLNHETGCFNPYFVSMADPISKPLIEFLLIASFLLCPHASSDIPFIVAHKKPSLNRFKTGTMYAPILFY